MDRQDRANGRGISRHRMVPPRIHPTVQALPDTKLSPTGVRLTSAISSIAIDASTVVTTLLAPRYDKKHKEMVPVDITPFFIECHHPVCITVMYNCYVDTGFLINPGMCGRFSERGSKALGKNRTDGN